MVLPKFVFQFAAAGLVFLLALAGNTSAQPIQTLAPYAILIDADTHTILLEKDADGLMAPASTAKLMTAEIVFQQIAAGHLKLTDEFVISENAWRTGGSLSHGSSMFAVLNSRVSVENLIRGLVIASGNDAAIALAEGVAGSEGAFSTLMNQRASELGMEHSVFTNPWGRGDPEQRVTARDMARLAGHVIATYPDFYKYFGEKDFTWNKIKQANRNPLLTMDIGADGLKTGDIKESGFGLVGSAVQNGQRLILVINGLKTAKDRADEGRKLLQWGFRAFEAKSIFNAGDVVGSAKMFGGARSEVPLVALGPVKLLVPRGSSDRISARIIYTGPVAAPVEQGAIIARLQVMRGTQQVLEVPLKAEQSVAVGTFTQRALDAGWEWGAVMVRKVFSRK